MSTLLLLRHGTNRVNVAPPAAAAGSAGNRDLRRSKRNVLSPGSGQLLQTVGTAMNPGNRRHPSVVLRLLRTTLPPTSVTDSAKVIRRRTRSTLQH